MCVCVVLDTRFPPTTRPPPSAGPAAGAGIGRQLGRRFFPVSIEPTTVHVRVPSPLADSFLVLMILAAYSCPEDFFTHLRTTEKAPLPRDHNRVQGRSTRNLW